MNQKVAKVIELIKNDMKDFDFDDKIDYLSEILNWADDVYLKLWDSEEGMEEDD